MTGLPVQIPQQSVPLLQSSKRPPEYMNVNWYLWAYNISLSVNGNGIPALPASPYDFFDSVNLIAQGADVPQAYRGLENLAIQLAMPALQDPMPAAQPTQNVIPGASPFTYTALANGLLSVTGGAVSAVSIIRQGVTIATGIGSSSSSTISSLTDEHGSGGGVGFVAGVDFTAGTSTTLTLSKSYGAAANLWVAFDAGEQGADSYTLSGTTLTFNAAIPVGTSKVYVKGALPSTINTSGGLVPLRRLDQVQITYSSTPTVVFLPD